MLLNISVGLAGFFIFWIAALFCEYLDYVLFRHLLINSKEYQKHVQAYSLKYLDSCFEALYNLTKNFVPYTSLLNSRKIVPMIPEMNFWDMFGQVMENFAISGLLQFALFIAFDVIHFRLMMLDIRASF
jgi:hypothetical protein